MQDNKPNAAVVILAAGKGTRMKSDQAKVLHELAGRPMLEYVLDLAASLQASPVVVVVGHQAGQVKQAVGARPGLDFALQEPQLGTGHAVMAAMPALDGFDGPVVVLYGDVPGLRTETVRDLLESHAGEGNALTVLAMDLDDPAHYGRLVTDAGGRLEAIVEYRDADEAQRAITLVNSGIYVMASEPLRRGLSELKTDNEQGEYYLTDLVGLFFDWGLPMGWRVCPDPAEVAGINSQEELAAYAKRLTGRAGN
jgi:UDP-N-acetylglucosamine diphosphorylase/glucosamine-1-phosphate N-acetyltransferase